MLLNLSSDNIYILVWDRRIDLSRGQLERNISQTIIDIYNQYKPQNIYIINWPGSFTNLRLGCLAINLLVYMLGQSGQSVPNIFTIDKISLYQTLTKPTLIYIGQKANYRLLQNWNFTKVSLADITPSADIYIDNTSTSGSLSVNNVSFDNITFDYRDGHICMLDQDISWLFAPVLWAISPNYMMEPNVG